jgi:hypothetical protein
MAAALAGSTFLLESPFILTIGLSIYLFERLSLRLLRHAIRTQKHQSSRNLERGSRPHQGNLFWKIILFTLPVMISSLLQLLYSTADLFVVSNFGGGTLSDGGVGNNGSLINLMVNTFVAVSVGANVVVARYKGEQNKEKLPSSDECGHADRRDFGTRGRELEAISWPIRCLRRWERRARSCRYASVAYLQNLFHRFALFDDLQFRQCDLAGFGR